MKIKVETHWEYSQIWLGLDKDFYSEILKDGGRLIFLSRDNTEELISKLTSSLQFYDSIESQAISHDTYYESTL